MQYVLLGNVSPMVLLIAGLLSLDYHWYQCFENCGDIDWIVIQRTDPDIPFSNIFSSAIPTILHQGRHGIQQNNNCKLTAKFRRGEDVSRRPSYTGNVESWMGNPCGWETHWNVPLGEGNFIPSRKYLFGFSKYNSTLYMLSSPLATINFILWQINIYTHNKYHINKFPWTSFNDTTFCKILTQYTT